MIGIIITLIMLLVCGAKVYKNRDVLDVWKSLMIAVIMVAYCLVMYFIWR